MTGKSACAWPIAKGFKTRLFHNYYQANRKDVTYNINLIAAAFGISMVLLDHIVMEPDGYFSYRDAGLLTYLKN